MYPSAVMIDGLSLQQPAEQGEGFVRQLSAAPVIDTEVDVLLDPVADAESVGDPAFGNDVQHTDLLGEPHRIPERDRHRGQQDRQMLGPRSDGRGQEMRRGQMTVVGRVMLGQHGDDGTAVFGPLAHIDRSPIQVGRRCRTRRCAHVEPKSEHPPHHNLNFVPRYPASVGSLTVSTDDCYVPDQTLGFGGSHG